MITHKSQYAPNREIKKYYNTEGHVQCICYTPFPVSLHSIVSIMAVIAFLAVVFIDYAYHPAKLIMKPIETLFLSIIVIIFLIYGIKKTLNGVQYFHHKTTFIFNNIGLCIKKYGGTLVILHWEDLELITALRFVLKFNSGERIMFPRKFWNKHWHQENDAFKELLGDLIESKLEKKICGIETAMKIMREKNR